MLNLSRLGGKNRFALLRILIRSQNLDLEVRNEQFHSVIFYIILLYLHRPEAKRVSNQPQHFDKQNASKDSFAKRTRKRVIC